MKEYERVTRLPASCLHRQAGAACDLWCLRHHVRFMVLAAAAYTVAALPIPMAICPTIRCVLLG